MSDIGVMLVLAVISYRLYLVSLALERIAAALEERNRK